MLSASPRHALRKAQGPLLGDLPPSYAHLEAEESHKTRRDYIRQWHPDMSPTRAGVSLPASLIADDSTPAPSNPTPNGTGPSAAELDTMSADEVSREAVEKWKSLKRELGFECDVIDRALEARRASTPIPGPSTPQKPTPSATEEGLSSEEYVKTLTPRLAREWANQIKAAADAEERERSEQEQGDDETPSPPGSPSRKQKQRSPRWQFYNLYNSVFYPTPERAQPAVAPKRGWNLTLTSMGVWALVLMTGKLSGITLRANTLLSKTASPP